MSGEHPRQKKLRARYYLGNHLVASLLAKKARILVVREHPESLIYQVSDRKTHMAKSIKLGYGNNDRDWAIRMLITYSRYVKTMVRRQRLNGIRLAMKGETPGASLRYSPSFGETQRPRRWEALPIPTNLRLQRQLQTIKTEKQNIENSFYISVCVNSMIRQLTWKIKIY